MPITITIPGIESWDEDNDRFVNTDSHTVKLEHSLVSLSKWEAIFHKPFLGPEKKSGPETIAYIHAMCLDEEVPISVFANLSQENVEEINAYIENPMTATTFKELPNAPASANRGQFITNDLIRYWMIALEIPLEYETRHLNQLFTVIKIINEKNKPKKKMSRSEIAAQQRTLNAQRRQQLGTNG